jgi:hypothetical protein
MAPIDPEWVSVFPAFAGQTLILAYPVIVQQQLSGQTMDSAMRQGDAVGHPPKTDRGHPR